MAQIATVWSPRLASYMRHLTLLNIGRVQAPEIVFVGSTTAGKSSLVNALIHQKVLQVANPPTEFTRPVGQTTRFPLRFVLETADTDPVYELTLPRRNEPNICRDLSQVYDHLNNFQTRELTANMFLKDTAEIRARGRHFPTLTLVDIPGFQIVGKDPGVEDQNVQLTLKEIFREQVADQPAREIVFVISSSEMASPLLVLGHQFFVEPPSSLLSRTVCVVSKADLYPDKLDFDISELKKRGYPKVAATAFTTSPEDEQDPETQGRHYAVNERKETELFNQVRPNPLHNELFGVRALQAHLQQKLYVNLWNTIRQGITEADENRKAAEKCRGVEEVKEALREQIMCKVQGYTGGEPSLFSRVQKSLNDEGGSIVSKVLTNQLSPMPSFEVPTLDNQTAIKNFRTTLQQPKVREEISRKFFGQFKLSPNPFLDQDKIISVVSNDIKRAVTDPIETINNDAAQQVNNVFQNFISKTVQEISNSLRDSAFDAARFENKLKTEITLSVNDMFADWQKTTISSLEWTREGTPALFQMKDNFAALVDALLVSFPFDEVQDIKNTHDLDDQIRPLHRVLLASLVDGKVPVEDTFDPSVSTLLCALSVIFYHTLYANTFKTFSAIVQQSLLGTMTRAYIHQKVITNLLENVDSFIRVDGVVNRQELIEKAKKQAKSLTDLLNTISQDNELKRELQM